MKMPKKGPWTVAEDTVLVEYIKRHGEGNWNMVERNSGLMRCGKSCRLRWFNHLRPNLKRGTFSPEEERIVVELHAQFGNRWARMAMQLPGRSDNEIKNFWNTRAKRLERAGLPLYPAGLNIAQNNPIRDQNHTNHLSSSNETYFSYPNEIISNPLLLQSYPNPQNPEFKLSPDLSMGPFSYSRPTNPTPILPNSNFTNYSSYPRNENGYNFRLGSISFSSASTMHYPNFQTCSNSTYPFQSQSTNFGSNPNPMLNSYEPQCLFDELSLIQSLLEPPGACELSNELNLTDTSKCYNPQYSYTPLYSNDGLLEDICGKSRNFVPNDKDLSGKGKDICMWDSDCGLSSPYNTTMGMQNCEPFEEMFPFDDLPTLLESFPMEPEVPSNNWYQGLCGNSPNKNNSELKYLSI